MEELGYTEYEGVADMQGFDDVAVLEGGDVMLEDEPTFGESMSEAVSEGYDDWDDDLDY